MMATGENIEKDLLAERAEKERLIQELNQMKVFFAEMEATNNHLISATWREREMKKKLTDTITELNDTRQIVETQNKRIEESINYARRIQQAINPAEEDLKSFFEESFILYLPKDIISGDFPWIFKTPNYLYAASVDCTGHGVPGAMMSMIGTLLLNDIVNNGTEPTPAEVLLSLHNAVVSTLKQSAAANNHSNDGMDIGLCRIDKKNNCLMFSGAHRPLFFMRNKEVIIHSGDKFPIGGTQYKGKNNYTNHTLQYSTGDKIFTFTDGFPDQLGGPEKRRLMVSAIKSFIEQHAHVPMQDLKGAVRNLFMNWKGQGRQLDDVLMMGIELN